MNLLVFGLGYSGRAIAGAAVAAGWRVTATSRSNPLPDQAGVTVVAFEAAADAVGQATHLVSTVPPDSGDPVLGRYAAAIVGAPKLGWLGYVSTTGVYGDRDGGWVDEQTEPAPGQDRSRDRLDAEQAWRDAAGERLALDLFRTAGIYGPGRSALDDVRAGRGRRIRKPGHAFGRIHRDDIAGAVLAAAGQARGPGGRVLHLSDGLPAPNADVVAEAAALLGVAPPPEVAFAEAVASMSEMARSFWAENRRVDSRLTQQWLHRPWRYPTYREGLRAILAEQAVP